MDKSVMDGGMVGQMDKAATICSPFGEHKNIGNRHPRWLPYLIKSFTFHFLQNLQN